MKTIKLGIGYILLALLSFIFSGLGFAGLLNTGTTIEKSSTYFGVMFLFGGIFFLSCFFKRKK